MDQFAIDLLTRRAALLTIGAAGVAHRAASDVSAARERKRKRRKRSKGDVNARCQQQALDWTAFINDLCSNIPPGIPNPCSAYLACGEPLKTCDFSAFVACYLEPGD